MELGITAAVAAAMCLILGVVLREAVEGMISSLHRRLSRSAANAPKTGEQVQCSLRAVSGPVHGIGIQWIDGSGTFTHQSMRFEPTGSTEGTTIPVLSIERAAPDGSHGVIRNTRVHVHTTDGVLECSLPRGAADRVRHVVALPSTIAG